MLCEITDTPLAVDPLIAKLSRNTCGAVASFVGIVREFSRGRQVLFLEYDAYPEMAEARHNLGTLRRLQGRLVEAEGLFREALARKPSWAESHRGLGVAPLSRCLEAAAGLLGLRRALGSPVILRLERRG